MKYITIFMIIFILVPFSYVQVNKVLYANKVTNYLIEEENYTREEIKSVKGIWGIKLPAFYVVVAFKDEPHVEYIYFAHNSVMQFDYIMIQNENQKDNTELDLKHYKPLG